MRTSGYYRKGCKWARKWKVKKAATTKRPAQLRYGRWIHRHYQANFTRTGKPSGTQRNQHPQP
jgi:hypothetical protein